MQLDFSFIISASKGLYIYKNNKIQQIFVGGVMFGISSYRNGYIALNRNNYDGTGGGMNTNSENSLEFFNKDFVHIHTLKVPCIKDGHRITVYNDDLYVTNTGMNLITKIKFNGEVTNFAPDEKYGKDINHYNSISFNNDKIYICQHRKNEKDDGGVSVFNKDWQFLEYINIGKHAHDCEVFNNFLYSTDSFAGNLIKVDLTNKKQISFPITKYMTRGIIIKDDIILIGLSEFDSRESRHLPKMGRIMAYRLSNMEYLGLIELPDAGQINNLLLI